MRSYLLCYDIRDPRRWKRVHDIALGYGDPLQYSVFQCIVTPERKVLLMDALRQVINHHEDCVLLIDMGSAENFGLRMESLGAQGTIDGPGPVVL